MLLTPFLSVKLYGFREFQNVMIESLNTAREIENVFFLATLHIKKLQSLTPLIQQNRPHKQKTCQLVSQLTPFLRVKLFGNREFQNVMPESLNRPVEFENSTVQMENTLIQSLNMTSEIENVIISPTTLTLKKNTKKPVPLGTDFLVPSDVLLSQGETPNYHRR